MYNKLFYMHAWLHDTAHNISHEQDARQSIIRGIELASDWYQQNKHPDSALFSICAGRYHHFAQF